MDWHIQVGLPKHNDITDALDDEFGGLSLRSFAKVIGNRYGWLVVDMGGDGLESVTSVDGFAQTQ